MSESGIPNPESGDRQPSPRVKFGPAFACCPTARPLLIACALTLSGTCSIVAFGLGANDSLPIFHPRLSGWIEIACVVSFFAALLLSLVGTVSVIIRGLDRPGEVVIRGKRYSGMVVSKIALSIFALPWIVLGIMIAFFGLR